MRLGRRPRRVPGLGPRFTRALGSVADAPGRSLATIGADSGPVSSVIAGIERLGGALLDEGLQRRREVALYEADQAGADEGARNALEGRLVELQEGDTESARVFNTALQASYFANLDLAVADKADALALEHSADPEAFNTRFDGVREGVLANLPPEWRGEAAVEMEKRRRLYLRDITANALDQAEDGANADLIRAMDGYAGRAFDAARRDKDGFEDQAVKWAAALEARTDLSAQAKEEAKLRFEAETRRHAVLGDFETAIEGGSANGEAFIDRFAESEGIADPDERARLAGEMSGMLRTVQAQEKRVADENDAARKIQEDTQFANLDILVRTAKTGQDLDNAQRELQSALESGLFAEHPDKYADLVVALDKREETYGKKIEGHRTVAAVLGGDKPAMPGDDGYRKNVDDYYDDVLAPALGQAEPADASELRVETVRRTGHIPKTVRAEWESAFAAGNADQKIMAADEIARVTDSPNGQAAVERLPSDTRLRALGLHKLRMAGMDPEEAVKSVEARMDPKNKAAQETAKAELKEHRKNYEAWLEDHFDPTGLPDFLPFGESNDAALPGTIGERAELVDDFTALFEDAFLVARDAESAKEVALGTLDRVWGVTRAEGAPRAIKYPPEGFYPMEPDALSKQLSEDVEAAMTRGHPGLQDVKPEIGGLQLVSDSRTAREASTGRPTWAVTVLDENGIFQPVLGKSGRPMRWAPDAGKAAEEKTRKAMEKVRRLRKEGARSNPERSRVLGNAALVDALNSGYDAIRKRAKGGE